MLVTLLGKHEGNYILLFFILLTDTYLGCFEDRRVRLLDQQYMRVTKLTISSCKELCRKRGKKYAGVEVTQCLTAEIVQWKDSSILFCTKDNGNRT